MRREEMGVMRGEMGVTREEMGVMRGEMWVMRREMWVRQMVSDGGMREGENEGQRGEMAEGNGMYV